MGDFGARSTAVTSITADDAEHLPAAALEADGECPAGGSEPCTLSALQLRMHKAEATLQNDSASTGTNTSGDDDVVPKNLIFVGEGYCCWDEESCKPEEDKDSSGGAYFATEDGTQCLNPKNCPGTAVELCARMEGCQAVTLFSEGTPKYYAFDCHLHWNSQKLCNELCDAEPDDGTCRSHVGPSSFGQCGKWTDECGNLKSDMSNISADGTKNRWCYKKVD